MDNPLTSEFRSSRLPAEWEEQEAVLLVWPHEKTDWAANLSAVQLTFIEIIQAISKFEIVVLIVHDKEVVEPRLESAGVDLQKVRLVTLSYNDTWTRDFGPFCVDTTQGPLLLDFSFNGWGRKFNADLDNQLTRSLARSGTFRQEAVESIDLVLEGGSLESDGAGVLMTTSNCLLDKNRNPQLSQLEIENKLLQLFGAQKLLWLDHGILQGDDTDGHIDTLARFAPHNTIIYQGCQKKQDEHFQPMTAMRNQLETFQNIKDQAYKLVELPWPQACHDSEGHRLPASYANFLIINGAILVPTYAGPADQEALQVLAATFSQREIIPIDCCSLLQQRGSLHCVTMQLAKGVLA